MKLEQNTLHLTALVLAFAPTAMAQYAPPPPPRPFPGFINEALRKNDPYMNQWDIGGAWRMRYETKDGYGIAGSPGSTDFRSNNADTSNSYLLSRIRLRLGYTSKWWGALAEGRSSLVGSDDRAAATAPVARFGDGPESDSIDLHQAWVNIGNHKEFPFSLKVGRQEMNFMEGRLVGDFVWNNIGRVFDAAKLRWQNSLFAADIFTSRVVIPEDGRFNVSNDYDYFSGFHAVSPVIKNHSLELYGYSRNASPFAASAEPSPQFPQPTARDIYTMGVRIKSNPGALGAWDYTLDAIGQLGNYRDTRAGASTSRLDHEAYAFIAQGGYTFSETWSTPRLGLEYAHASGDSNPTDGKHSTFENLFPTNHKFYGYGDLVSLQNIHDVRTILQSKPHPQLSLALEGHLFWLADTADNFYNVGGVPRGGVAATPGTGFGINPGYSSFVGSELDFVAGYAVTRYAQLELGYSRFFAGDYIDQTYTAATHGSRDANFFYLQMNLNF